MIYVTDGSFEGILTAVFEAFRLKENPDHITLGGDFQLSMDPELREIPPTPEIGSGLAWYSEQDFGGITGNTLQGLFERASRVGLYIYRYIKLGLKLGCKVEGYLQNPDVQAILDLNNRVAAESHLFLGLLRFKKLRSGIFYASYEPDNNITQLITDHFARRLAGQAWIIHDKKRDIFALYNGEEVIFTSGLSDLEHLACEEEYEELWKRYFATIAIESRKNPKLQRSFMPYRYWKNLVEKQP